MRKTNANAKLKQQQQQQWKKKLSKQINNKTVSNKHYKGYRVIHKNLRWICVSAAAKYSCMCTVCTHCVAWYYSEIIAQDMQWNEQILDCLYCQMRSFRSIFLHIAKALRLFLWLDSMWDVPVCVWRCFYTLRAMVIVSHAPVATASAMRFFLLFFAVDNWFIARFHAAMSQ